MQSEIWRIIISTFAFIGIWVLVIGLVSLLSGWSRLAQHYRDFDNYQGKKLRGKFGNFGWASYGGVLILGANMQGMYLAVNFLFSIGHPPLFIPWVDIRSEEQKGLFGNETTLIFAQAPNVKLTISSKLMAQVQELKSGNRV